MEKLNMEKQKLANNIASTQPGGETCSFICTVCGDGFKQYSSVVSHMAVHGPLESFAFDGSSNGFEVPREYILQENGTLVVNDSTQSHLNLRPASPGVLPSHLPFPVKPVTSNPRPQPCIPDFTPSPSDLTLDKCQQSCYYCEKCGKSFTSVRSLHHHQQYRNTERGYKCTLCCKIFEGGEELKKHLQDHNNESFCCCGFCGKRFLKVDLLITHQKEIPECCVTSLPHLKKNDEKRLEKSYSCKKCKLFFFWMSDFQAHSLYHCQGKELITNFASKIEINDNSKHPESPFKNCISNGTSVEPKNGENGDSKLSLRDSNNKMDKENSFTPYRCGLCGDRFHKLTDLKEHHFTHQTQEEIDQLNEESEKNVKRKLLPKIRRRRNTQNGKLHPCKHCHRVFNHSSSLSRHMRFHKGTMHACVFCGRHFPQRCDMRRHVVTYHKTELEKKPGLKLLYIAPRSGPILISLNGDENPRSQDEKTKNVSAHTEQKTSPEEKPTEINTERSSYNCQECGRVFGLLSVYQRHFRHHKKVPRSKSSAQLDNSSSLEHSQSHLSNEDVCGSVQTSQCDTMVKSQNSVTEKVQTENTDEKCLDHQQRDQSNVSDTLYECTECTETFSCLEIFFQHQASHASEKNG